MDKLLEVIRAQAYDKRPTVDVLAKDAELEKVSGTERDAAWAAYELEQKALVEADGLKNDTTATTKTTPDAEPKKQDKPKTVASDKPTHTVTVKKDGFRRCGRAWSGSEETKLTAEQVKVLEADPMFVVVEL
tara:strand:- start:42745 stop:43140 length:396 start_codon:yes stop_codon:yes gene_type:complete